MRWNIHRKLVKRVQVTVRDLRIPPLDPADTLGDLVAVFEERLGYSIAVVTTENDSMINGVLESRPGGGTAIVVPAGTTTSNRHRHLVCRGLARCLYRELGHRTGRIDYSTVTEHEIEYTALFLGTTPNSDTAAPRGCPPRRGGGCSAGVTPHPRSWSCRAVCGGGVVVMARAAPAKSSGRRRSAPMREVAQLNGKRG